MSVPILQYWRGATGCKTTPQRYTTAVVAGTLVTLVHCYAAREKVRQYLVLNTASSIMKGILVSWVDDESSLVCFFALPDANTVLSGGGARLTKAGRIGQAELYCVASKVQNRF